MLPWDHLDSGLDKEWLWQDWQDALTEVEVDDCRWTPCFDCGVCPQMGTDIQVGPTGRDPAAAAERPVAGARRAGRYAVTTSGDLTAPGDVRPPVPSELLDDPWFPFTGDVRVKALLDPVDPRAAARQTWPVTARQCARADDTFVWTNAHWRLTALPSRPSSWASCCWRPATTTTPSRTCPTTCWPSSGPLTARIERAILGLGGIARVHVLRYGDGGEHFHLWFMPRPLGALQMRGSMLPVWMDVLPKLPEAEIDEALDRIAAALDDA